MTTTTTRRSTGERPPPPMATSWTSARASPVGAGRLTLGLLVSAQFVVMLDTSIVNVALPSIQADLGLGAADATWIVNAYVVAFGGLLLLSGRLADLFGRRGMFTAGLGPVHRRHAAGSRGRGPGAADGGPRRPGRRRRRTQPGRHVTAHAGLPRSSASQGHEHLGRRLDAGRSHGGRAGRTARRLLGLAVGVPRDRADIGRGCRRGPSRASEERSRTTASVRLGRCRFHHRSGRRPGARRPVRGRPGMDGPTRRRRALPSRQR